MHWIMKWMECHMMKKMTLVHSLLVDYEKDNEEKRDISNKGCKRSDEELKIILSDAPTKENCINMPDCLKEDMVV